jgi:hypothetical protein
VIYIERARGGNVWIVGEINDDVRPETLVSFRSPPTSSPFEATKSGPELRSVPSPCYWSVSRLGDAEYGFLLNGVALTASPARLGSRPVEFRGGGAHMAARRATDWNERT